LEEFVSAPVNELIHHYGLKTEVAQAVKTTRDQALQLADELYRQGIHILTLGTPDYPTHLVQVLGETAPPVLFAKGNIGILERKAVGFSGSRKTSDKGLRIASESASILAESDINIVSGYANGTDLAAHHAALETGGVTTFVLVEGILQFKVKRELAKLLNEENYVAVSEFLPRTKWIARNAMQRNRTICGLSDAMIMIESGLSGGTFAAGETTLELNQPLFVVEYGEPPQSAEGNSYFLDRGAQPLRGNREGKPNLDAVFGVLTQADTPPVQNPIPKQPELFSENAISSHSQQPQTATNKEVEPMPLTTKYPKRLIEVDLPIKKISAHARREKSIRHGHISTLHIWWARRPLAACRAVICAALWPDPADPLCPQEFRNRTSTLITEFAKKAAKDKDLAAHCSTEIWNKWQVLAKPENALDPNNIHHLNILRNSLLDFIADFANWDNSTQQDYLETSRDLTQAAHEALGGIPGTKPLVIDPFAGGGSIPLEALRVGADAFASDLNPVAVLLNKVEVEYIPKYGQQLADEVRKWGQWVKEQTEQELAEFYPKDPDKATPIAYLWARTIISEAPDDGTGIPVEVPLIKSLWLTKKKGRNKALRWVRDKHNCVKTEIIDVTYADKITRTVRRPLLEIFEPESAKAVENGTVTKGSATCPVTGYTTPVASVRKQFKNRNGGASDARLFCVVTTKLGQLGRLYRLPNQQDIEAVDRAAKELKRREHRYNNSLSLIPDEEISLNELQRITVPIYGMKTWGDIFTPRQLLALTTLAQLVSQVNQERDKHSNNELATAVQTCLALAVDRCANQFSSLSKWHSGREIVDGVFARQAVPMLWDFGEINPLGSDKGYWLGAINWITAVFDNLLLASCGYAEQATATAHPLPDDAAHALITDPPYYDAVPYAHLSDFFYVGLRRSLGNVYSDLLKDTQVPKEAEIVVDRIHRLSHSKKNISFYEQELAKAFADGCRVLQPNGIGTVVFASKTTASWEAILKAVVDAGWIITGSWPIDTEMENRVAAQGQARLASSIHLVCRPRENPDGSLREEIGDWRDVLQELPQRIHEWMPRLASEGVVGADAIFACLGPALEIFSRYSRVEKASGEQVTLKDYLEYVWAAVSKEALSMIFTDADATGFEEDARLTAMWMWTLSAGTTDTNSDSSEPESEAEDEEETSSKSTKTSGYVLEFDAARKIAQGLGAHLENLRTLIQVKGDQARLLPVSERAPYLFGKDQGKTPTKRKKKEVQQLTLFTLPGNDEEESTDWGETAVEKLGNTVLDRIHQSMILFAAGRSEALKRFLVEDGVGADQRFWKLAQALSALYPNGTDEKRWVDGVLARKKGLGF
jgi:DNA protecting protein DprA